MASPFFELNEILALEAQELIDARKKAFTLHHTNDIDAAGDEIEQKVREILRRKLPYDYYIGHGHIVDQDLKYNGQHDIVIADNSGSPILFSAKNGTEYFPYESLYIIGEVKSTFRSNSNYIESYIEKVSKLYNELNREVTPPSQLSKDVSFEGDGSVVITSNDTRPYKNPIMKFMFFVDGGDFILEEVMEIYKNKDKRFIPNFICILNKGILVQSHIPSIVPGVDNKLGPLELFPEFIENDKKNEYKWAFVEFGHELNPLAAQLAFVIFALNHHLRNCLVLRPNLMTYFSKLLTVNSGHIFEYSF